MNPKAGAAAFVLIGIGAYLYSMQSAQAAANPQYSDNGYYPDEFGFDAFTDPFAYAPSDTSYIPDAAQYAFDVFDFNPFEGTEADYSAVADTYDYATIIQTGANMAIGRDWKINEYPKYANIIREAERINGIPQDLFARQLAKESSYLPDIIDGRRRSTVGAMGIAQFMPATASDYGLLPGTGPGTRTDPVASIHAGAKYMRDLHKMFNSWKYALMAYNWGPGNVRKWLRGETGKDGKPITPPAETREYFAAISADVIITT